MLDFDKLIDDHIKRESRPKGIGRYYPSEAGMCLRKVWYSYKTPAQAKPDLAKIFAMGNIIHDFVVDVLSSERQKEVELLKTEFPFREKIGDFEISGRVDDLILVKASGKTYLVEVKSTKSIDYVKEAAPHNIVQLQLYMHFIGVHNGFLLYVDKTNLKTKLFELQYNQKEAEKILARFQALHTHLKDNTIPEPEARAHQDLGWMCKYCEYLEKCHADTPRARCEEE